MKSQATGCLIERSEPNPLRVLRAVRGMSQAEAAERAGITREWFNRLETGHGRPRPATARAIAAVFAVDYALLFPETSNAGPAMAGAAKGVTAPEDAS